MPRCVDGPRLPRPSRHEAVPPPPLPPCLSPSDEAFRLLRAENADLRAALAASEAQVARLQEIIRQLTEQGGDD